MTWLLVLHLLTVEGERTMAIFPTASLEACNGLAQDMGTGLGAKIESYECRPTASSEGKAT